MQVYIQSNLSVQMFQVVFKVISTIPCYFIDSLTEALMSNGERERPFTYSLCYTLRSSEAEVFLFENANSLRVLTLQQTSQKKKDCSFLF